MSYTHINHSCSRESQVFSLKIFIKKLFRKYFKRIDKVSAIDYTLNMEKRVVKIAQIGEKAPFIEWMDSLDNVTRIRTQSRLTRLL